MGSVGSPNPWSPYDNFKDCSLQICSIYCPQFCYFIFPPPPPDDDDDHAPFSPLIIAIIAVLASAFLLLSYYTIVTRFCRRRQSGTTHNSDNEETTNHRENAAANHDQWQVGGSAGLDESVIKTIPFCRYVKGGKLIDGTECAVCLSEFREGESLRLLPKCSHAFHLPCVDTWLKSHSNCPLCRAGVGPVMDSPAAVDLDDGSGDLVLTVDDDGGGGGGGGDGGVGDRDEGSDVKRVLRRSVSLDEFTVMPRLLVSGVLRIDENEGSWRGIMGNSSKGSEMRRCVSTGRIP